MDAGGGPRILTDPHFLDKDAINGQLYHPFFCSLSLSNSMTVPLSEAALPPRCETCGIGTVRIGKLPRIGLRPLVYVYKCDACNKITSVEPERQEETIRRRPVSARRPRR
jgi:hypothetical protein